MRLNGSKSRRRSEIDEGELAAARGGNLTGATGGQRATKTRDRGSAADLETQEYFVEEQIGFLLRIAFQHHTAIFMSQMVANLTQTQFATLSRIHRCGECSQADLVEALEIDSATINGVVSRMRARGLLGIATDPSDRRRQFLSLTPEGREVIEEAERVGSQITEKTLELLTATEQSRLAQLLCKITHRSPAKRTRLTSRRSG